MERSRGGEVSSWDDENGARPTNSRMSIDVTCAVQNGEGVGSTAISLEARGTRRQRRTGDAQPQVWPNPLRLLLLPLTATTAINSLS
jgi:hypothetical protein